MNRGNRRNASSQARGRANARSNTAVTPVRGGAGNNNNNNNNNNPSNSRSNQLTPVRGGSGNNNNNANNSQSKREEDETNHVPGTNVVRIMRRVLPPNAKISDDAKEAVQQCVSEYISFITSEANERCQREQRKTVTPEDILYAMAKLGLDNYVQPLTLYLNRYRESESQRTSVEGVPNVFRTVNYQGPQAPPSPQSPPLPPPPPPAVYFNPQVAPPPPSYFVNPAEAMSGQQGYLVAPPGSTVDAAGPSSIVAYAPGGSTSGYPYNASYPPQSGYYPGGQFFP